MRASRISKPEESTPQKPTASVKPGVLRSVKPGVLPEQRPSFLIQFDAGPPGEDNDAQLFAQTRTLRIRQMDGLEISTDKLDLALKNLPMALVTEPKVLRANDQNSHRAAFGYAGD